TPTYYKNNAETWPADQLSLGGETYERPALLSILHMLPSDDVTIAMAQALIAAKFNVARGVETPAIATTIAAADAWLSAFPISQGTVREDWQEGVDLLRQLQQVNNGANGPGLCPGEEPEQIDIRPGPTNTPPPSPTSTATATAEPTATW